MKRYPITAEQAEAEPYAQRLFSRPAPAMSPATRAMFARAEQQQAQRPAQKRRAA